MTSDNQCPGLLLSEGRQSESAGGPARRKQSLATSFFIPSQNLSCLRCCSPLPSRSDLVKEGRNRSLRLQHVQNRPLGKLLLQVNHFADFLWSVRGQVPLLSGDTFQLNCSILQSGTISNSNMKENGLSPLPGFVTAQKKPCIKQRQRMSYFRSNREALVWEMPSAAATL